MYAISNTNQFGLIVGERYRILSTTPNNRGMGEHYRVMFVDGFESTISDRWFD